jgi:hypothetical protein
MNLGRILVVFESYVRKMNKHGLCVPQVRPPNVRVAKLVRNLIEVNYSQAIGPNSPISISWLVSLSIELELGSTNPIAVSLDWALIHSDLGSTFWGFITSFQFHLAWCKLEICGWNRWRGRFPWWLSRNKVRRYLLEGNGLHDTGVHHGLAGLLIFDNALKQLAKHAVELTIVWRLISLWRHGHLLRSSGRHESRQLTRYLRLNLRLGLLSGTLLILVKAVVLGELVKLLHNSLVVLNLLLLLESSLQLLIFLNFLV